LTKRSEKDVRIRGNRNFYSEDESFFEQRLNTSISFYDRFIQGLSKRDMLPLVNYTELNQTMTKIEKHGFKGKKSKVEGLFFPRWNLLSKLRSTVSNQQTSAIMIAGDSTLEN
jgi:hypothetical protein